MICELLLNLEDLLKNTPTLERGCPDATKNKEIRAQNAAVPINGAQVSLTVKGKKSKGKEFYVTVSNLQWR
jgi:hypothetical protein